MDYVVTFFLLGGLFFFTGGSIGILRLPDFYSRLHAAGKLDTMGAFMMSRRPVPVHPGPFHPGRSVYQPEDHLHRGVHVPGKPHRHSRYFRRGYEGGRSALDERQKKEITVLWQLDLFILSLVIICAIAAITVKDLMGAAILFGAYSFLMCLLWAIMGAVDVAFTEASVGAGVSTVFFVAAVFHTTRRSKD